MNKRIISLLLAIVLTLGTLLSLSSCMAMINAIIDSGDSSGENGTPNNNGSSNVGVSDEDPAADTNAGNTKLPAPEFYPSAGGVGDSSENASLTSRALLSVVSIFASFEIKYGYPSYSTETSTSRGSGVIYKLDRESGNAYIITNYHVIYNSSASGDSKVSKSIKILLYGQENDSYAIPATYVGGSLENDIAVLKVTNNEVIKNSNALAATIADSDTLAVFDKVYVVGSPEGYGISATDGIVSVDSEILPMTGADGRTTIRPRVIRVSAAINDGNSGGGLFDAAGQLVGIVNAKRQGTSIDNIGYAIPTNVAARLAENIIYFCEGTSNTSAKKAMLGVEITTKVMGTAVDENGRVIKVELPEISEIFTGAAVTGLIEVGDRINSITVDGLTKQTTRTYQALDMMYLARVGSIVTLNVTRADEILEVTFTVTAAMFGTV